MRVPLGRSERRDMATFRTSRPRLGAGGFLRAGFLEDRPQADLNYGIRYDVVNPLHESYNRMGAFNPGVSECRSGGLPGALTFWGSGDGRTGGRRSTISTGALSVPAWESLCPERQDQYSSVLRDRL